MAHFCELDENNIVKRVVVVDDNEVGENGSVAGEQYCQNLFGGGTWKQTSYGTTGGVHYTKAADGTWSESADQSKAFRKNYAGKNAIYDPVNDGFYFPKNQEIGMDDSWTLNSTTFFWDPPVAYPPLPGEEAEGTPGYYSDGTKLGHPYVWKSTRWETTPDAQDYPGDEREFYWNPDTSAWVLIS
tara:strand:- start:273 stop:827 length:555 start_codon:yes stop_codon:yes gene_type:complete